MPASQPTATINPQRNCPAKKNAATGSDQRYQTPCENEQIANSNVNQTASRHFGFDKPCVCQQKRIVSNPAVVTKNGRPSESRPAVSTHSADAPKAISHASGRFSHGSADQPTRTNKKTMEKFTSH